MYQRTSVPASHRGIVALWHRSSGAAGQRGRVQRAKSQTWNLAKSELECIEMLVPFDFILIMIMALVLTFLIKSINVRILFQLNCIPKYWIDYLFQRLHTIGTQVSIDLIWIVVIFEIENGMKLFWIHMIYVLILQQMRMQSKLKMKMNCNNCKLNCNTMCQLQLTQVMLHLSQCCNVQLFGMSNIYLFIYLIL